MMVWIILFIGMYPVLLILYFCMRNVGEAKDGYSFGVRMKENWVRHEEMKQIIQDYKGQLKWITLVLAVVPLPSFAIPHFSVQFTVWLLWLLAVVSIPLIPYVLANKKVLELKRQKGWQQAGQEAVLIELKGAGKLRRVKALPFLVPVVISAAAAVWSIYLSGQTGLWAYGGMIVAFAVITLMFYLIALWMDRQRTEVISGDSEVNLNYARAKKNTWKNLWLALAWFNTAFTLFALAVMVLDELRMSAFLWGCVAYTLVTFLLFVWAWRKLVHIEKCYVEKKDAAAEENGDDCWIWGMFYYNKNDKRIMVNKRVGIGTTMNTATPVGMGMSIFAVIVLLSLPFFCVWMILEEFTPIHLTVENQALVAEHIRNDYKIPLERIDDIELIDEIPKWSKVSGTGMENLEKGTFHIRNVGKCEVFLNPQNTVFLHFDAEGTEYYMSGLDDDETMEIYELLVQ